MGHTRVQRTSFVSPLTSTPHSRGWVDPEGLARPELHVGRVAPMAIDDGLLVIYELRFAILSPFYCYNDNGDEDCYCTHKLYPHGHLRGHLLPFLAGLPPGLRSYSRFACTLDRLRECHSLLIELLFRQLRQGCRFDYFHNSSKISSLQCDCD